jgi:hypothetical protein
MPKPVAMVCVVLLLTSAFPVRARQALPALRPNFSGTWVFDATASPGVYELGRYQPSFASAFVARQTASQLTITHDVGPPPQSMTVVYQLDGAESPNLELTHRTMSEATWHVGQLQINTHLADADLALPRNNLERVLWFDATGRLIIQTRNGLDEPYSTVYRRVN